jgi:hypothetical protein
MKRSVSRIITITGEKKKYLYASDKAFPAMGEDVEVMRRLDLIPECTRYCVIYKLSPSGEFIVRVCDDIPDVRPCGSDAGDPDQYFNVCFLPRDSRWDGRRVSREVKILA